MYSSLLLLEQVQQPLHSTAQQIDKQHLNHDKRVAISEHEGSLVPM